VLTMAERVGRLATQDARLAEAARALGVTVVDRERFLTISPPAAQNQPLGGAHSDSD